MSGQMLPHEILVMRSGQADCVLVGLNEQSIGVNHQAALIMPMQDKMPKDDNEIASEGRKPSTLFREFAVECTELAQTASSPEQKALYMTMASVWHRMAQRWEKKS